MNRFEQVREGILGCVHELVEEGYVPGDVPMDAITAEPPKDKSHGDIATNAAMVLAKPAKKNPREIAEKLVEKCERLDGIAQIQIAGPGFINLTFTHAFWQRLITVILEEGIAYGTTDSGRGTKVNVEYVSANPTGPMHIGHARGAVVGDVLANVLAKAGYDVTREYYINDAGAQVDTLARSAYLRYREACGEAIEIPEGYYPGDYLKVVGQSLQAKHGNDLLEHEEAEWLPVVKNVALQAMLELIRQDLADLGVHHDVFTSEQFLHDAGAIETAIGELETIGLVYEGVLEPPKGKQPEDWEPREQTLFKSTMFGDDVDRPLKKADGSYTYFAADIAYLKHKLGRGFEHLVLGLGADHGGYVKRMKAATKALSHGKVDIQIILHQLVKLFENGREFKMSKRAGTFVTVRDMIDTVGKDPLRFTMLTRKADAVLDFDVALALEQTKDNPVFYVQYAHARIHSVLRHAFELVGPDVRDRIKLADFSLLQQEAELHLLKTMAEWPRVVDMAAKHAEPHRIAYYLQTLASDFHQLWTIGNKDAAMRFITPEDEMTTLARLAMITACATTIASGLHVMGVEPVERM